MTKIFLNGRLGQVFGKEWSLSVRTPKEALRAIDANTNGKFFSYLIESAKTKNVSYSILIGDLEVKSKDDLVLFNGPIGKNEAIIITPVIGGKFDGGFLVSLLISLVVGVALTLVQMAMMPEIDMGNSETRRDSYLFSGGPQPAKQGKAVPIGYGRMIVPPIPISVIYDYSASQRLSALSSNYLEYLTSMAIDEKGNLVYFWRKYHSLPSKYNDSNESKYTYYNIDIASISITEDKYDFSYNDVLVDVGQEIGNVLPSNLVKGMRLTSGYLQNNVYGTFLNHVFSDFIGEEMVPVSSGIYWGIQRLKRGGYSDSQAEFLINNIYAPEPNKWYANNNLNASSINTFPYDSGYALTGYITNDYIKYIKGGDVYIRYKAESIQGWGYYNGYIEGTV